MAESSRCTLGLLGVGICWRGTGHIDQRAAIGVPGPRSIGHTVPAHIGAQLFAGNPSSQRTLKLVAPVDRRSPAFCQHLINVLFVEFEHGGDGRPLLRCDSEHAAS